MKPAHRTASNGILTSTAAAAVLGNAYGAPDQEFYVRELIRLTGFAPRTVQVQIEKLVNAGLLSERRDGNRRYLRAEKGHPLFAPLREILLKTTGIVPALREALGNEGVTSAFVFGSVASGGAGKDSDVDLLVIGSAGLRSIASRVRRVQSALGREINPVVWTPAELSRRQATGDSFLTRVQTSPRLVVVGHDNDLADLGSQRVAPSTRGNS